MSRLRVVLDTNVVLAGVYSDSGASYQVLTRWADGSFEGCLSVPLVLEYEHTLLDHLSTLAQTQEEISDILDHLCAISLRRTIFYLWRPFLTDPKDDMVLEVAVASQSDLIVTHNKRHFAGVERFAIEALTPGEFLTRLKRKS